LLQVIPWVLFYIQAEWVARAWATQEEEEEAVVLPSVEEMDAHRLEFEAALIAGENRCGETLCVFYCAFSVVVSEQLDHLTRQARDKREDTL
jgi:hypothetical protein